MAKEKVSKDEKFEKQDFDLFEALAALDRKDYGYFDTLTPEQQKKFVPFMMVQWMSAVKGAANLQAYYLMSTEATANKYLLNDHLSKHPKLQWMMLCAASPGVGKQFHQWIPQIRDKVSKLKEEPTVKEMKEYFKKIYPKAADGDLTDIGEAYVETAKRKVYLANKYPGMKLDEIELLSDLITEEDIKKYEEDSGNKY